MKYWIKYSVVFVLENNAVFKASRQSLIDSAFFLLYKNYQCLTINFYCMKRLEFLFRKLVPILSPEALCENVPNAEGYKECIAFRQKLRENFKKYHEAIKNGNAEEAKSARYFFSWFIPQQSFAAFHLKEYAYDYISCGQYFVAVDVLSIFVACPEAVGKEKMYEIYQDFKKYLKHC